MLGARPPASLCTLALLILVAASACGDPAAPPLSPTTAPSAAPAAPDLDLDACRARHRQRSDPARPVRRGGNLAPARQGEPPPPPRAEAQRDHLPLCRRPARRARRRSPLRRSPGPARG